MSVLIATSLGDIVVDLHTDKCPLTSKNFLKLCNLNIYVQWIMGVHGHGSIVDGAIAFKANGATCFRIKYYNGCLFHTVQKDFTAQTGDPTGTGSGGDSIYKFLYGDQARFFSDEIHLDLKHSKTGIVAMASAGENLNASQFYLTLRDDLDYLDGKHTVFGEVAEGLDTLTRINEAYVDEKGRPYKNIRIKHTYILDDPFDDPPQLSELIPEASPEGKPKDEVDDDVRLEDDWEPMDDQLGPAELEEVLRSKEAHSSAVVLESIGDIPDAEMKPPDNVLFVCKLNPVTEDEDLHTIFSRFGTVSSAEIIRDSKTGDSLCYAFIEFETNDACEQAYFKMDNALIDDRRIHVDFSQSVAKLWSQYRRKDHKMGRERGCFKCGALDHIAKDCTGGPAVEQQTQKYILKDDNRQRGGDNNSSYEMVFDGETQESPNQEKSHRGGHDPDDQGEKQKMLRRSAEDPRHRNRDQETKEWSNRHKHNDKSRGYTQVEVSRDSKSRFSSGSKREGDYFEEKRDREKYKRRDIDDIDRDERVYKKRTPDNDSHAERREDGDYRKRNRDSSSHVGSRDEREYRKRGEENNSSKGRSNGRDYRNDDRDYRKRKAESERRETMDEVSEGKRNANGDSYSHKGRREEREDGMRNTSGDTRHQSERRRR